MNISVLANLFMDVLFLPLQFSPVWLLLLVLISVYLISKPVKYLLWGKY